MQEIKAKNRNNYYSNDSVNINDLYVKNMIWNGILYEDTFLFIISYVKYHIVKRPVYVFFLKKKYIYIYAYIYTNIYIYIYI